MLSQWVLKCEFWVELSNMVQLNQHLRHYDLYCGATIVARLHNLCHVDSRVTMLRYSLRGHAQDYNH